MKLHAHSKEHKSDGNTATTVQTDNNHYPLQTWNPDLGNCVFKYLQEHRIYKAD